MAMSGWARARARRWRASARQPLQSAAFGVPVPAGEDHPDAVTRTPSLGQGHGLTHGP
jgi:hypothetical protein